MPLATLAGLAGIALDGFGSAAGSGWWVLAVIGLAAWSVAWRRRAFTRGMAWLLVVYLALGGAWHDHFFRRFSIEDLGLAARAEPQSVCAELIAVSAGTRIAPATDGWGPPIDESTRLTVRVRRVRDGRQWRRACGRAELRVRGVVEVLPGDRLLVYGRLIRPRPSENPGDFDDAGRRNMRRELMVLSVSRPECLNVLHTAGWYYPPRWLAHIRRHAHQVLAIHMTPHHAELSAALLLGERENLSPATIDAFFATGTIHLLAISGMHLSILLYAIVLALRLGWLTRRHAIVLSCALVIPYALVTQCQPPIVRAASFTVIAAGARLLWRRILVWNIFAVAALAVVLLNPCYLFQVGVHLSFLAVAGLVFTGHWFGFRTTDPLDRLVQRTRAWPLRQVRHTSIGLARLWLTSLVIWLLTLPLIASTFYLVSPAAIVLNPILWPPVAGALLSGFALILAGSFSVVLAGPLAWFCEACLAASEALVTWAAEVAATHFWIPSPPLWWVAAFYMLTALWAAVPALRRPRWMWITTLGIWSLVGVLLVMGPRWGRSSGRLFCTFFAVGHGTCVVMELPDGRVVLYDAGRLGPPQPVVRCVSRYLWSRGVSRLDRVFISHADADHFSALPQLVERFHTREVLAPAHVHDHPSPLVERLRGHLASHGVPLRLAYAPRRLTLPGPVELEFLHPPGGRGEGSDNSQSIVLAIRYRGRSLLLPGDLESPGLERVLAQPAPPCDVVMAPHHGSARSGPAEFMRWCRPKIVVISSGRPAASTTLDAFSTSGRTVYETCRTGAVRVEIDARGELRVRTWRGDPW